MRIQFLCLYLLCNLSLFAEEIEVSRNYLLEHYRLRDHSYGIGFSSENKDNRSGFAWIHFGKQFLANLTLNSILYGESSQTKVKDVVPIFQSYYYQTVELQFKHNFQVSPGIQYKFFSLYGNFQSFQTPNLDLAIGFQLYPEKSLFFYYKENPRENIRSYSFSVLSGRNPGLGLAITKDFSSNRNEWYGSVGISFQFDSFQAVTSHYVQEEIEQNSFLLSRIFQDNSDPLFHKEINPYQNESEVKPDINKREKKEFLKKERAIYEISIDELLKFRIPLVIAIRIARASKSKELYTELLSKLPPDIVKKCNKIQFIKSKGKR